jgi:molybdopterin converting factor small subunit
MNSTLLKEAIADAKAVRATALANAKVALEEAFNSRFSAVFADKLREDSTVQQTDEIPVAETTEPKDAKPSKNDGTKSWAGNNKGPGPTDKNITPSSVPAGKDGGDGTKKLSSDNKGNAFDGTPNGIKESAVEDVEIPSVEETVTNEDLDEIIAELEAEAGADASPLDDPSAGAGNQMPGGDDMGSSPESAEEHAQEIKAGDTVTITGTVSKSPTENEAPTTEPTVAGGTSSVEPTTEPTQPEMEEEIDLNELLANLNEEAKNDEEEEEKEEKCDESSVLRTQLSETIAQREEAYRTVEYLQKQINEVNLLNAKLLYTNKLFKEFGMNRDQKTKVVEAFDLTKNVREVKMTYANWCESLNLGGNLKKKMISQSPMSQVTTITEGFSSKTIGSTKPVNIVTEGFDDQARRFQKLAGINVK